jgi:hypothetical protein
MLFSSFFVETTSLYSQYVSPSVCWWSRLHYHIEELVWYVCNTDLPFPNYIPQHKKKNLNCLYTHTYIYIYIYIYIYTHTLLHRITQYSSTPRFTNLQHIFIITKSHKNTIKSHTSSTLTNTLIYNSNTHTHTHTYIYIYIYIHTHTHTRMLCLIKPYSSYPPYLLRDQNIDNRDTHTLEVRVPAWKDH